MYQVYYGAKLTKNLAKLKKRDKNQYEQVKNKIDSITSMPLHEYKNLSNYLHGFQRVHIGHFVLVFSIDTVNETIYFVDYNHHDHIY